MVRGRYLTIIMAANENLHAYLQMKDELIRNHHGKVAVFHGGKLTTVQDDVEKAISYAKKKTHGRDFFVKELYTPDEQASAIL